MRDCICEAVRTLEFMAREKGLALSWTVDADVPDRLVGDPNRLRQVLLNLINNAMKFTAAGSVRVEAILESERRSGAATLQCDRYRNRAFGRATEADL